MEFNELFIEDPNSDEEILRTGIIAELDAISLYKRLAIKTTNKKIKERLLDIAKEEEVHVGEFEGLLKEIVPGYIDRIKDGENEH